MLNPLRAGFPLDGLRVSLYSRRPPCHPAMTILFVRLLLNYGNLKGDLSYDRQRSTVEFSSPDRGV